MPSRSVKMTAPGVPARRTTGGDLRRLCPIAETNHAYIPRGAVAEIAAPVFVLSETPRNSRPASPLPIAFPRLHKTFDGAPPPTCTSDLGQITLQARYFPKAHRAGLAVPSCP